MYSWPKFIENASGAANRVDDVIGSMEFVGVVWGKEDVCNGVLTALLLMPYI